MTQQKNIEMQQCIQNCTDCHHMCVETIQHCLQMGGKHADPIHIRLMLDGAEICQTSANFMIRGSDLHIYTCAVCAEVCELCAQDCERVGPGDEMMARCAELCRRCSASCRQMAAA
jgi:hypothetical protein